MFNALTTGLALAAALAGAVLAGPARAETHEVHMLKRGETGMMVFEPAFLRITPGDTVTFLSVDRGHNAEAIEGMIPAGAELFSGAINDEISVTFDVEGLYGVRCTPHFAMGMVMTIAVGDAVTAPGDFLEGRLPRTALQRFEDQLGNL